MDEMKVIMLSKISQAEKHKYSWSQLYVEFGGKKKVELIEPVSGMVVARGRLKKHVIISIDGGKHLIKVNIY